MPPVAIFNGSEFVLLSPRHPNSQFTAHSRHQAQAKVRLQPRSGERMQPTAQAVGRSRKTENSAPRGERLGRGSVNSGDNACLLNSRTAISTALCDICPCVAQSIHPIMAPRAACNNQEQKQQVLTAQDFAPK